VIGEYGFGRSGAVAGPWRSPFRRQAISQRDGFHECGFSRPIFPDEDCGRGQIESLIKDLRHRRQGGRPPTAVEKVDRVFGHPSDRKAMRRHAPFLQAPPAVFSPAQRGRTGTKQRPEPSKVLFRAPATPRNTANHLSHPVRSNRAVSRSPRGVANVEAALDSRRLCVSLSTGESVHATSSVQHCVDEHPRVVASG
jgi:hypothetical protein